MISPCPTIKAIALVMLMLHLLLPPFVHAHGLALVAPERLRSTDVVCVAVDDVADHAGHDSPDDHHHDAGICHLDTPFVVTHFRTHVVTPVIIELPPPYAGRLLPGHSSPVYVPPRGAA